MVILRIKSFPAKPVPLLVDGSREFHDIRLRSTHYFYDDPGVPRGAGKLALFKRKLFINKIPFKRWLSRYVRVYIQPGYLTSVARCDLSQDNTAFLYLIRSIYIFILRLSSRLFVSYGAGVKGE